MSINLLLEMSRRSFRALDAAMNTTGQNVANAETEGYARRRITLSPYTVNPMGIQTRPAKGSVMGAGVSVETYERLRDGLLQRASWEMGAAVGFSDEEQRITSALEGLFPVDSDGSLTAQLTGFWNAWSDLADSPTENGLRLTVRSRAAGLASTFNRLDADIRTLQAETQGALTGGIDSVNDLLHKIAALNETLSYAHHQGSPDLDAADQRDLLVSQLAEYAPIKVQEGEAGTLTITLDGMAVVQDQNVLGLALDASTVPPTVRFDGTNVEYRGGDDASGRIGAWLRVLQETLPDALSGLDTVAGAIAREVNNRHTTGFTPNGTTGVDFFHEAGTDGLTAATIRLSAAVESDSLNIAASAGNPVTHVHDSTIALALAGLAEEKVLNGGTDSVGSFLINLVGGIGAQVERASAQLDSRSATATHLAAMEQGVSGVSIEEEMTNLIQYQHAYQASARVLNTVQDMLDTLFAI